MILDYKNLTKEQKEFVFFYGLVNCEFKIFKSEKEILKILKREFPTNKITKEQKEFINKNQNQQVLVYIYKHGHSNIDYPDIFVCGEDDTPFTNDCFL